MTPALWLERTAKIHPDAPALYVGADLKCDYAGFADSAARIAGSLKNQYGIKAGDRVVVFLSNRVEYLQLIYGVWYAGGVVVPINHKLHPREAAWMIDNCTARLVFAEPKTALDLTADLDPAQSVVIDVQAPACVALWHGDPLPKPVARGPEDLAWLFYTSGTTGRPKGVMLSNANLMAMTQSYFVDVDAVMGENTALYAAPMSHGAGLYNFVFVLRAASHVIPPSGRFDPGEVRQMAQEHDNICMFAAPTMVRRLVSEAVENGYDGQGLKTIVYGGGPMYVADIEEAVAVFGPRFVQIYGQGESPMTITALSRDLVADRSHPDWQKRLASVGTAQSAVDVMIADQTGQEVPHGAVGEILVKGPPVMQGYWNNSEASANTIKDGWLWTGDVGSMDADGFITLSDRSKDVIISGGSNIYPREVEEVLLTHPSVYQVSVVGKPDPEWGEVVVAFVVTADEGAIDKEALDAHCLNALARFKRPKAYIFVRALPQNSYGKVLKTELRAMLSD